MFASVSTRSKQKVQFKQDGETLVPLQSKTIDPKASRSLGTKRLQNLTAILHVSLLRRDIKRAERAFAILLRCEKQGVSLRTLWELGLEVALRSTGVSSGRAEEFLARVRLASSDIGHKPATQKKVPQFR